MGSHGRRRTEKDEAESHHEPITFKLQVRVGDDELRLSTATVQSEYATKYLESIGVKPCSKTMDFVHKHIPLTDACVKTTLRVSDMRSVLFRFP